MFATRRDILAFLGKTLLLLPVALALWYFAAPVLNAVAAHAARAPIAIVSGARVSSPVMHGRVARYELEQHAPYELARSLPPAMTELEVNASTYSFGLALFLALSLAVRASRRAVPLAIGTVALLLVPAWGVCFDILRQLLTVPELAPYLGFSGAAREAIALGYQFGSLLLPTLAPIALWLGLNQRTLLPVPAGPTGGTL